YDQVRAITRSNIEDRFKERTLELSVGKPLDRRLIHRAEELIRDLLGEKGYLDATVKSEIDRVSDTSSAVRFRIRQGPRTRIRRIEFVGNEVFSDGKLKRAMKLTRQRSLLTSLSGKDVYFPLKYDQDIEKVRELYQNSGYLDVDLKPPLVEISASGRRGRTGSASRDEAQPEISPPGGQPPTPAPAEARVEPAGVVPPPEEEADRARRRRERNDAKQRKDAERQASAAERKERKWVYLTVRVKEGPQYRIGEIKTTGNTIFSDKEILAVFDKIQVRRGDTFNRSVVDAGVDVVRSMYGQKGYIYASVGRSVEKRDNSAADITLEIREDRPYYVERVEFEGNTTTRDEVLR
ncbi:MAG: POTRA domain-containing protein, partial [Vicinamibacteria bacterium]